MTESVPVPQDKKDDSNMVKPNLETLEEDDQDLQRADWEGMTPQEPIEVDEELVQILTDDLIQGSTPG